MSASKCVITCDWDEVPHLDEDTKARLLAEIPPYQRDARSKGIPQLGAGAIYQVPESEIKVPDFALPVYWPRGYALDVGWRKTAALWVAYDRETGTRYLYSEHYQGSAEPSVHAEAIRARGPWMSGRIDPAAQGRSQADGRRLIESYRGRGLTLEPAKNAVEAGIYETWMLLASGRLKVFASLSAFFGEYRLYRRDEKGRIVKKADHLMDCVRMLVLCGVDWLMVDPGIEQRAKADEWTGESRPSAGAWMAW